MQHRDNSDVRVTTSNIVKGKEYPVVMTVGHPHHSFTASKTATVVHPLVWSYTKQHSYSERYRLQGDSKKYMYKTHVEANHATMEIDTVMDCTQVEGPLARRSSDHREQYHVNSACSASSTRDQHLHSRVLRPRCRLVQTLCYDRRWMYIEVHITNAEGTYTRTHS
jgi:hypothetical protein